MQNPVHKNREKFNRPKTHVDRKNDYVRSKNKIKKEEILELDEDNKSKVNNEST